MSDENEGVTRRQMVSVATMSTVVPALLPPASNDAGQARARWVASRDEVSALTIDATTDMLVIIRYDDRTPPCPARYVRSTNRQSHPGHVRSVDGAVWQIAEPIVDVFMLGSDGGAVQRAIDCLFGRPGRVRLPDHEFVISQPIQIGSGQTLSGIGWATVAGTDHVVSGSRIRYGNIAAAIEIAGSDADHPVERTRIEGIALTGDGSGMGVRISYARHLAIDDLYVSKAAVGLHWGPVVWQGRYSRIQCFNNRIGFELDSGAEDSTFENCIVRYGDVAARINYHGQTNMFVGCDFSYTRVAVQLIGGMIVNATFLSCSFEMEGDRGGPSSVFEILAPSSGKEETWPSVTVDSCRFHAAGPKARALPIFRIERAGHVTLRDARPGGVFGAIVQCDDASQIARIVLQDNARLSDTLWSGDARLPARLLQR